MANKRIGILGDGQLARMLGESALSMGLKPLLLCQGAHSPGAKIGAEWVQGDFKTEPALKSFFSKVDLVLFENEFVDVPLLRKASAGFSVQFVPELSVIETLQQKLGQKKVLQSLNIPASEWISFSVNLVSWLLKCEVELSLPFVLKWSLLGYDGKGVLVVKSPQKQAKDIEQFFIEAEKRKSEVFAEKFIPFVRELAIVATYSKKDGVLHYPLVISEQTNGVCHRVTGPAVELKVSPELEEAAREYAQRLALGANLEGTFAIEFFETEDGELLVNEIAPRVHNTGHYTMNACPTSQFENHIRAALGEPLGDPTPSSPFMMLNLLGPAGVRVQTQTTEFLPKTKGSKYPLVCHWYGKEEIVPGRKLGHLNGLAPNARELVQLQKEMDEWHHQWVENLK